MSKKGYADYAILEYRVERIAKTKRRLKSEARDDHRTKRLLSKKIALKRQEENHLWIKLHNDRRDAQRKGTWNENYERIVEHGL